MSHSLEDSPRICVRCRYYVRLENGIYHCTCHAVERNIKTQLIWDWKMEQVERKKIYHKFPSFWRTEGQIYASFGKGGEVNFYDSKSGISYTKELKRFTPLDDPPPRSVNGGDADGWKGRDTWLELKKTRGDHEKEIQRGKQRYQQDKYGWRKRREEGLQRLKEQGFTSFRGKIYPADMIGISEQGFPMLAKQKYQRVGECVVRSPHQYPPKNQRVDRLRGIKLIHTCGNRLCVNPKHQIKKSKGRRPLWSERFERPNRVITGGPKVYYCTLGHMVLDQIGVCEICGEIIVTARTDSFRARADKAQKEVEEIRKLQKTHRHIKMCGGGHEYPGSRRYCPFCAYERDLKYRTDLSNSIKEKSK